MEAERNLFFCLEYEGTRYCGWQRQPTGPTVQAEVEKALERVLGERVRVRGAGRTDAGVHAYGQAAHAFVRSALPARAILHETNRTLPEDIVLRRVEDAPADFSARRHARRRHYRYRLLNRRMAPAVDRRTWTHAPQPLDRARLAQAVALYEGHHEFAAFRSSACTAKRTSLTMESSRLTIDGDRLILDFACRSFLHNMVRILVGTALDVARGRISLKQVERLLGGSGSRSMAGRTAPPEGLALVGIEYGDPFEGLSTL